MLKQSATSRPFVMDNFFKAKDFIKTQLFYRSQDGKETSLISIFGLLREMNRTDEFVKLATEKAGVGLLIDKISVEHIAKYAKIVVRHDPKNNTFSIGKDKWKFNNYDELCYFLSDIKSLVSLFCIDRPQEKKQEKATDTKQIKDYIKSKVTDVKSFTNFSCRFKMLDFLNDNCLMADLISKLERLQNEIPELHAFNSVPESVIVEYVDSGSMEYVGDICVRCSYNQQDEHFTPIRVFRDEETMLQFLMEPINLVKKLDEHGNVIRAKKTDKLSKSDFNRFIDDFIRSTPPIPYSVNVVYHRINMNDVDSIAQAKRGLKSKDLKELYNKGIKNPNEFLVFIDMSFLGEEQKYQLVGKDNAVVVDWTSDKNNIRSYLYDVYLKQGLDEQKQTNFYKRTTFDAALNEYIRSNTSIPYKKGIVYHPINLMDFAMWFCGRKNGHDNQLLDIYNAPTVYLGNYRFFVENGEARISEKLRYCLRSATGRTIVDWTTEVNDIFAYLFNNYVKSGFA